MRNPKNTSSLQAAGDSILLESVKYGPVVTFLLMAVISFGVAYLIYGYLLSGWAEANDQHRQAVLKKEIETRRPRRCSRASRSFVPSSKRS